MENAASNHIYHHRNPGDSPIKTWTNGLEIEDSAMEQLRNVSVLPFIHKHIAVMPDVHWGMGATIGSVIPTVGAIIPAAVGVDIGCGMQAVNTGLTAKDLPDNLATIRTAIEKAVPHGRTNDGKPGDRGAWGNPPAIVAKAWREQANIAGTLEWLLDKYPKLIKRGRYEQRSINHLGTLGTGNHFIEVCLDENEAVWVMLHSGSRGIGNAIGMFFIEKAKEDMRRYFVNLPDKNLAYLPEGTEYFADYVTAVGWAQNYAATNRNIMMQATLDAIATTLARELQPIDQAVQCHHNYIEKEHHFGQNVWVTRKGAVRAREGDLGIIPGSMGVQSYIVRGKGNPESFNSCSHGAGRSMSRGQARRTISLTEHQAAVAHVECRKDEGVLDESPAAYKDIDAVMAAQTDLVKVVHTLKQVICVKG